MDQAFHHLRADLRVVAPLPPSASDLDIGTMKMDNRGRLPEPDF